MRGVPRHVDDHLQRRVGLLVEHSIRRRDVVEPHRVGDKGGDGEAALDSQPDRGAGEPVAVPAVLQVRRNAGYLRADQLHPVVVELLPQVQPSAVALKEAADADAGVVGDGSDRLLQSAVVPGHLEHDVGTAPIRELPHVFRDTSRARVERDVCPELERERATSGDAVDDDDPPSVETRELSDELSRDPEAEHDDRLTDMDVGIEHDGEGDRPDVGEDSDAGIDGRIQDAGRCDRRREDGGRAVTPRSPHPVAERNTVCFFADFDHLPDFLIAEAGERIARFLAAGLEQPGLRIPGLREIGGAPPVASQLGAGRDAREQRADTHLTGLQRRLRFLDHLHDPLRGEADD
jgi:hypothetical protein